ncbi:NADH dehydrogenase [ubiquinone] 1 alpha subcomplex subunit 10, mitochondrial isoform X2 [Sitophilus oryzae]|uniref:NADH dehydrogenase [ubiquinone] 1 alpha subcomplex subunit 10, mitochondrial n=1 Tax=Sitophilus oryzae TaxID=7048 RepID=A0A6J2XJH7_SITOR|nr:NADH dehydrogenase [ubiquinone] 1 alpha subcomplex subunit 10, mitochondrial isoform X2 [Sitophilus oryzae]
MLSVPRIGVIRFVGNNINKNVISKINIQSTRTITSKLDDLPVKPKPWAYNEKHFTLLNYPFDKTSSRFDENTKLIVVEGSVAAGKSKFAKEIAKSFGMFYMPEANLDMNYINYYGYDLKNLDPLLAPDCRSFDVMDFLKNPKHKLVARMQIQQYVVRLSQYIDALAHILSTGQGVVLDRCVYSDFVFAETLYNQGFISRPAYKKYYEYRDNTLQELIKPHLVIYLDVPVPNVLENIKKRNISYEVNSPAMNENYLGVLEKFYKQKYLKDISTHAELLVYDWSVEGDMEVVVEDIEAIDFDRFEPQGTHFKDWDIDSEEEWAMLRYRYASQKHEILAYLNIPCYEVPELLVDPEEADDYHKIMNSAPGEQYLPGFNASMGDKNILFKTKAPIRETLPLRERRI